MVQVRELIEDCKAKTSTALVLNGFDIKDLNDFPALFECTHLSSLELADNKISDLSPLKVFNNLTYLNLHDNQLSDITPLQELIRLQELDLSENHISVLNSLRHLVGLKKLDISDNVIENIESLSALKSLAVLNLSRNRVSDISSLSPLANLNYLNLNHNNIKKITSLAMLENMITLDIGNNKISNFKAIENLTKIEILDIEKNEFIDLSFLKKLVKLKNINLFSNKIKDISPLENLNQLTTVNLNSNNISELPEWVLEKKYQLLYKRAWNDGFMTVYDNPLTGPPVEIVKQGISSVTNWYKAKKKRLNEVKVILIGDAQVGKTSLLRRLKHDDFKDDEVQTDGINIESINFGENRFFKNQKSLKGLIGHFWDFGGQEIFHATHQIFLTKRSLYILVLHARDDNDVASKIRKWVKKIRTTGGDSSIIIVCNQIDVHPGFGFANKYELQLEFPQIKYFLKISCSNGEGLEMLKQKMEELIPKVELFASKIDEKWINVKDQLQLETARKPYFLNENRFLQICRENQIYDYEEQQNTIEFLHDLGVVLNFKKLSLAEYYVLDPYWITYGVYQILTSERAAHNKGEISVEKDLFYIVNEEKDKKEAYQVDNKNRIIYSSNECLYLVDILHEFQLSFYVNNKRSHFIVPVLLENTEPLLLTIPIRKSINSIQFVYEYESSPEAIMPYIIVQLHNMTKNIWRTGCIVQYRDCSGLISSYSNKITITVDGENKEKCEFLLVLRCLIDSINSKLHLDPGELIPYPDNIGYAYYKELLEKEKAGEKTHKRYKLKEGTFLIADMLECITPISKDTVEQPSFLEIKNDLNQIKQNQESIVIGQKEIIQKQLGTLVQLDENYQYLIEQLGDSKRQGVLIDTLIKVSDIKNQDILKDITTLIGEVFDLYDGDMDEKFRNLYSDLKKSDNWEVKVKAGLSLLTVLNVGVEGKFDLKKWAQSMYKKYELPIFKALGYL